MSLCKLCLGINVNSIVPYNVSDAVTGIPFGTQVCYQHHRTFNDLEFSAKKCVMCDLLHHAICDRNPDEGLNANIKNLKASEQTGVWLIGGGNMFFDLTLPKRLSQLQINVGDCDGLQSAYLSLSAQPDDPLSLSGDIVGRSPASHSGSQHTLNLIRAWLSDCLTKHEGCIAKSSEGDKCESSMPKRLLHLGKQGKPSLIETEGHKYHYAALSYCWGTSRQVVTTTENYGQVTEGFGKTIQDALKMCLSLGFEYLWVDALCIIQNNDQDWQAEAAKMGMIYRQAMLTISATGAEDTSIGFLRPRPSPSIKPISLSSKCSNSDERGKIIIQVKPGSINEVLNRGPVNNRGWCLQERILSPRIIHFAEDQVYWECETLSHMEDGTVMDETSHFKRQLSNADSHRRVLSAWDNLLEDYMCRNLSYSSDIFPALAGLAVTVGQRLPDPTYYAGIWKHDLPFGLLWASSSSFASNPKPSEIYRAPSWSWASITGPITSSYTKSAVRTSKTLEFVEILQIKVVPQSQLNPLGRIISGELKLYGRVKDLNLAEVGIKYRFRQSRSWIDSKSTLPVISSQGMKIGELAFDDHTTGHYPSVVRGVMILKGTYNARYLGERKVVYFLALSLTNDEGVLKRIGVGFLNGNDYFDDVIPKDIIIV